ncbi:hypothetical protein MTO96_032584 [Rhipicephalus appendiculatus]
MHEQVTRASDVLEALNISTGALLSIQTELQLFRFVGQTSLRTGLPLVVSVRLRGDQLVLDAGRSLDLALQHGNVKEYLSETLKDLRLDDDDKTISDFLDIDASVTSWLNKVNKSDPLVTRRLGDLSSPFANATWTDALNTKALAAKVPALTADSLVQIRDEPLLNDALGVMSKIDVKRARLYAMVLLLAQVIRYRYILGTSGRATSHITTRQQRGTPAVGAKPASYEEDHFLRNVVRACAESVGRAWDEDGDVDRQLRASPQFTPSPPSSSGSAGDVVVISAALLAEPFFIGDPALAELDYGTVGVRVFAHWLDAELRSNATVRELISNLSIRCPPGDAGKDPIFDIAGDRKGGRGRAHLADVATEWALRTAWAASRAARPQPQYKVSPSETAEHQVHEEETWSMRHRVLFWRFCQSLCGDSRRAGPLRPRVVSRTGIPGVFRVSSPSIVRRSGQRRSCGRRFLSELMYSP